MREPLISENPFRLLRLASDTPYPSLRKHADAAIKGAQVGMARPVALIEVFGEGDFEELDSSVRSLATDPVRRTCYRLLWPLTPNTLVTLLDGNQSGFPAARVISEGFDDLVPGYALSQAKFLIAWYEFLATNEPGELQRALEHFNAFQGDEEGDDLLTSLISGEDRLPDTDAYDHVLAAQSRVGKHLLARAAGIAADLALRDRLDRACSIVDVILGSPFDSDEQEASLGRVVDFGDRLSEDVLARTREMTEITTGPPQEAEKLAALITAIGERHPAAKSWGDTLELCHSVLVSRWIDRAVDLANDEGKNYEALELLERCQTYSVAPEVSARLTKNLKTVRGNISAHLSTKVQTTIGGPAEPTPNSRPVPWGCIIWAVLAGIGGISALSSQSSTNAPNPASLSGVPTAQVPSGDSSATPMSSDRASDSSPTAPADDSSPVKGPPSIEIKPVQKAPPLTKAAGRLSTPAPSLPSEVDIQRERLIHEHDALVAEVDAERPGISSEQDEISSAKARLDSDKADLDRVAKELDDESASLDRQRNFLGDDDFSVAAFNRQVDEHNDKLTAYKSDLQSYNERVNAYNERLSAARAHLEAFNKKVDRVNELARQINSG